MLKVLLGALGALALSLPAGAQIAPFPGGFGTQEITTDDGATIHVRAGGQGPAVVPIHGIGDTGDMWAPLAAELARDHTVVVPDLRGMGLSSHPAVDVFELFRATLLADRAQFFRDIPAGPFYGFNRSGGRSRRASSTTGGGRG